MADAQVARAKAGARPKGTLTSVFGVVNGARVGTPPAGLPPELSFAFSDDGVNDLLNELNFFMRHELRIDQPLYTFGKIRSGIAAAELGAEAREAELERALDDAVLQTKRVYYGVKVSREVLRTLVEVEEAFGQAVDAAQAKLDEGSTDVTQTGLLQLRIALARAQKGRLEVERAEAEATLAFRRAVGVALTSSVAPDAARLRPVELVPFASIDAWVDVSQHPAMRAAFAGARAREKRVAVERARLAPDFFATIFFEGAWAPGRDDIDNPFVFDPFNIIRGGPALGLRWNLDVFDQLAQIDIAQAKADRVRAEAERAATGLPLQIRRAFLELEEKRAALQVAKRERKAGRTLSFLTLTNFRLGIGEPQEIMQSLGMYAQSATGYARAIHAYNMAVARLSNACSQELDAALLD